MYCEPLLPLKGTIFFYEYKSYWEVNFMLVLENKEIKTDLYIESWQFLKVTLHLPVKWALYVFRIVLSSGRL